MHRSYETTQDSSWESSGIASDDEERPGALRVVLAGVVGVVGGGLLAVGPYLSFSAAEGGASQTDLVRFPAPLLLVVLAGLVAAAGLGSVLFSRRPFGTALVGLSIAPAATLVAFQAPGVLALARSASGRESLRIGGWLVTAGTGVAALGVLLAFLVALSRFGARRGVSNPVLGAVAAAGLLQWWLVAPAGNGDLSGFRYLVVDAGGSLWPGATALCALAVLVAAVTVASARCGAAAIGVALGAALAVGLELGARYAVEPATLRRSVGGDLRGMPVILTGATAAVLLLLALGLAVATSRQAAETADALASRSARAGDGTAGWEQTGSVDPWPPADQASSSGVWGNSEETGAGRSWSSSETSSTKWPRT